MLTAIKIVFLYSFMWLRYLIQLGTVGAGVDSSKQIIIPPPYVVNGSGSHTSHFFHFFTFHGRGIVGVPIAKYWHHAGKLPTNSMNAMGVNSHMKISLSPTVWCDNTVRMYYGFSNYMPTTAPAENVLRWCGAFVLKILYTIDNALESFYTRAFSILNLDSTYGEGHGLNVWFAWCQEIGLAICVIVLLLYTIGTILAFNTPWFQRTKDIFTNVILVTFFIGALPTLVNVFGSGVQSFANSALGGGYGENIARSNRNETNQLFYNNVYSIPEYILNSQPGEMVHTDNGAIMKMPRSYMSRNIKAPQYMINLDGMSYHQQIQWNGDLQDTSIYNFLNTYSGDNDILTKGTLDNLASDGSISNYQKNIKSQAKKDKGASDDGFFHMLKTSFSMGDPGVNTINPKIVEAKGVKKNNAKAKKAPVIQKHVAKAKPSSPSSAKKASKLTTQGADSSSDSKYGPDDMANLLHYGVSSVGSNNTITRLESFGHWWNGKIPGLADSYALYKVNFANILIGLLLIGFVFLSFIYKLFNAFFKIFVTVAVSGMMLADNINDRSQIKYYIRSLFNMYEMLIMDIITIRLYFIMFNSMHGLVARIMTIGANPITGNEIVIGLITYVADFSLLMVALHGVDSIDKMLGVGANSGAGRGFMNSLMTMHLAGPAAGKVGAMGLGAVAGIGQGATALAGKSGSVGNALGSFAHRNQHNNGFGGSKQNGLHLGSHKHNNGAGSTKRNQDAINKLGGNKAQNAFGDPSNNEANKSDSNSKGINSSNNGVTGKGSNKSASDKATNDSNKDGANLSGHNNEANAKDNSTTNASATPNTNSSNDDSSNDGDTSNTGASDTGDSSDDSSNNDSDSGNTLSPSDITNGTDNGSDSDTPNFTGAQNDANDTNPATQNSPQGTKHQNNDGLGNLSKKSNNSNGNNSNPKFTGANNDANNSVNGRTNGIKHQQGSQQHHNIGQATNHNNNKPNLAHNNGARNIGNSHHTNGNHGNTPDFTALANGDTNPTSPNNNNTGGAVDNASTTGDDTETGLGNDSEPNNNATNAGTSTTNDGSADLADNNDAPTANGNTTAGASPIDSTVTPDATGGTGSTNPTETGTTGNVDGGTNFTDNNEAPTPTETGGTGNTVTDNSSAPIGSNPIDTATNDTSNVTNGSTPVNSTTPNVDTGADFTTNQEQPINTPHISSNNINPNENIPDTNPVDDPHKFDGINTRREEAQQARDNAEASTNSNPNESHFMGNQSSHNSAPNFTDLAKHLGNDADHNDFHKHN